jgi:hypothetical protein
VGFVVGVVEVVEFGPELRVEAGGGGGGGGGGREISFVRRRREFGGEFGFWVGELAFL